MAANIVEKIEKIYFQKKEKSITNKEDDFFPEIEEYRNLERDSYFYIPGKIVHIDMDELFLERCMKFYKKNKLKVHGILSNEENLTKDA